MTIAANGLNDLDANQIIKSSAGLTSDGQVAQKGINLAQLVPATYDFISMTYVTSGNGVGEIETVTYKQGGTSGTTVAILTLTYDSSNRIESITRS